MFALFFAFLPLSGNEFPDYFTNYKIEVDARWIDDEFTGNGYNLVFGLASDKSHFYLYQVNADQQKYRLLRFSDGSWEPPADGWVYTTAIYSGLNSNRLKVIRNGPEIILFVNDKYLETKIDNVISSGQVGLTVQTYPDELDARVRFDNYKFSICSKTELVHTDTNGNSEILITPTGKLPNPN